MFIVRPYVFLFLLAFLFISIRSRGVARTLFFLVFGYLIAWISEASSIRTGFPYGWYYYLYENLEGELLNWGVPVWDSLSYVFLCYAGLSLSEYIEMAPGGAGRGPPARPQSASGGRGLPGETGGRPWRHIKSCAISALFVTLLDIIIDPLANLGDKWFLGKIYYYPEPGFYFGVPWTNFAGWFLVSFLIVGAFVLIERAWQRVLPPVSPGSPRPPEADCGLAGGPLPAPPVASLFHPAPIFYFSIFLFNWVITLCIREWGLAAADLVWISIPTLLFFRQMRQGKRKRGFLRDISAGCGPR